MIENSTGIIIIRDYISRIRIHSILMEFLETSDCTDESRKDETCLQFKMKKHIVSKLEKNLNYCITYISKVIFMVKMVNYCVLLAPVEVNSRRLCSFDQFLKLCTLHARKLFFFRLIALSVFLNKRYIKAW